jgi:hypothetical protein
MNEVPEEAPPVGEELHIPGPSILPFVTAIAITLMVIGTTINWIFSGIGLAVFIVMVFLWIRDVRRDVGALPEDHAH